MFLTGRITEALTTLTGAACETERLQPDDADGPAVDTELLWAKMVAAKDKGYMMGAGVTLFCVSFSSSEKRSVLTPRVKPIQARDRRKQCFETRRAFSYLCFALQESAR